MMNKNKHEKGDIEIFFLSMPPSKLFRPWDYTSLFFFLLFVLFAASF